MNDSGRCTCSGRCACVGPRVCVSERGERGADGMEMRNFPSVGMSGRLHAPDREELRELEAKEDREARALAERQTAHDDAW